MIKSYHIHYLTLFSSLHTWVVPAASGSAAPPPLSLIERGAPFLHLAVLQGVCRQVAQLQAAELAQEVTERHPVETQSPTVEPCSSTDER